MRRIFFLAALLLLCAGALAQPPQRPAPAAQPEVFTGVVINPDYSVAFRYRNPKAVKVEVSGEFMEGSALLTEVDGVWTYTTGPLAPELYFYSLTVDGSPILDISWSVVKDIPRWMNYFIISKEPGDRGDVYGVNDVPHGTVASRWYDSATFHTRRRVNIYTPPGYEQNPKKKYPVFYLLHGNACDENSWLDLGRAAQVLDNLIAAGKAAPMILVMTNGNPAQQAAPAYDHGFLHVGQLVEHHFDFLREDVLPVGAQDHALAAAHEEQAPDLVQGAQVAGAEPAVRGEGRARGFRVFVVAGEHHVAAH